MELAAGMSVEPDDERPVCDLCGYMTLDSDLHGTKEDGLCLISVDGKIQEVPHWSKMG
jgi:hypothetical protein